MLHSCFLKLILSCSIVCFIAFEGKADFTEETKDIYAGVAQVEITPPVGYPHYRGISTGVSDPLYAKALVLREGDQQIALVVCDLLWIERKLSSDARLLISQQTNIPYSNIIISGTHSHTTPAYHHNIMELNEGLRPPSDPTGSKVKDDYPGWLTERIAQAVLDATKASVRVNIETGTGTGEGISFNRRFFMRDGTVLTNPGVGNSNIVGPVGPIDTEIGIVFLRRASDNQPLGSLTSFANHTDTFGGTEFSADYPDYLAKSLSAAFGNDFISVFGLGACGDINHVNVYNEGKRMSSKFIGEKLATSIKDEVPNLKKIDNPSLAARSEYVYAPLQQYTSEELAWAKRHYQAERSANPLSGNEKTISFEENPEFIYKEKPFLTRRRSVKIRSLERMRQTGEAIPPTIGKGPWTIPLEVQVFRIGKDAAIVGLPGELFVELSMAIKEASPFETTLVIELTNSHIAYVPTRKAFSQGSYETINSRLAPGGGEMMVESAVRLLNELSDL
jgi:neutral ceramidase